MSETALRWLVVGGLVLLVLAYRVTSRHAERRRSAHFALWASHCGSRVERKGELSQRFRVKLGDRELEVRDEYRGGGAGSNTTGSRYVSIVTALVGRAWDLHSVSIRLRLGRSSVPFSENAIKVEEFGLPLREGWLTPDVLSALAASFAAAHRRGVISIDGGELVYREITSPRSLSPEVLAALLDRHAELATAIERAR
jgi:hypothetical protein